jgi:hypothetical protein
MIYALVVVLFSQPMDSLQYLESENGILHCRLDLSHGGAITWISISGSNRNVVNTADEGRYIQQSYYAGKRLDRKTEGQSPNWSPWPWNPIQGGDACGNHPRITGHHKNGDTLYVKSLPLLWDMNNRSAEAEMEEWVILNGNVVKVRNKLTCHRTDDVYGEGTPNQQELPAVYPISAFQHLYSYFGKAPFTNAPLATPVVVNLSSGFWGRYEDDQVTEHWMAFVDDTLWGLGIYNPLCDNFFAGISGTPGREASDGSTAYIAPVKYESLDKNSTYQYEYYVIVGSLEEIRSTVYRLHAEERMRR